MDTELIGAVTISERDDLLKLHERRTALKELFVTLNSPWLAEDERTALKERIVDDLAMTTALYEAWWRERARQYNWGPRTNDQWMLDFEACEVRCQAADNCSSVSEVVEGSRVVESSPGATTI